MRSTAAALLLACAVRETDAHASLIIPTPRNAVDRSLPAFRDGRSPETPCTCSNGVGGPNAGTEGCDEGIRAGGGQACLWFNQGCSIGCDKCTGEGPGVAPHADKIGFRVRYCNSTLEPTLPKKFWTMNLGAEEGSVNDSYRYNPWRAPGYAPVGDACGIAGGRLPSQPSGGDAVYTTTQYATLGDGSDVLPPMPGGTVWTAGSSAEVAWGIRYNHGGGYQYRLCPRGPHLNNTISEECFQRMPLQFDRTKQALVWINGTRFPIEGAFVDSGVWPVGSTWARNPVPRINDDNKGLQDFAGCPGPNGRSGPRCMQFPAPCPQDNGPLPWTTDGSGQGWCSGDWTMGVISDRVLIPEDTVPGQYVLSWRYDAEETAQVWANCADITIVPPQ
eukprot:Hpha_TRINITY_DN206_c0_g1::TRINITY_DN206_c0_g1_i1::g.83750::m.83750